MPFKMNQVVGWGNLLAHFKGQISKGGEAWGMVPITITQLIKAPSHNLCVPVKGRPHKRMARNCADLAMNEDFPGRWQGNTRLDSGPGLQQTCETG